MNDKKKVGETSSGEVVNGFRSCRDLSDTVPLYAAQGIYLKPIAKIHVSINLPQLKTPGKTPVAKFCSTTYFFLSHNIKVILNFKLKY